MFRISGGNNRSMDAIEGVAESLKQAADDPAVKLGRFRT